MTAERKGGRRLVLVRHSTPEIVPGEPASRWRLSDDGRRRCTSLAQRLAAYQPVVVVASVEPKAAETAQLVAGHLALPCEAATRLHEHERDDIGWLPTREAFEGAIAGLFARPDDLRACEGITFTRRRRLRAAQWCSSTRRGTGAA